MVRRTLIKDMVRIERKLVAEFKCDFNHVMEIINSKLLTRACGHEIVEEDSCVRVRGIPWQCSDHDIVRVSNLKKTRNSFFRLKTLKKPISFVD